MNIEKIFLLSTIAALLELDSYYIGMFLISQPIIIGGITGFLLNDISTGILLGSIIQLIWINNPPVGAFVPPSTTTIAFISTYFSIILKNVFPEHDPNSIFMLSLIVGIPIGYFVGQIDIWHRKINIKIIHYFEKKILDNKITYIFLIQVISILIKFFSNLILFIIIIIFAMPIIEKFYSSLPNQLIRSLNISFWIMPIVGLAVIFNMLYSKIGGKLFGSMFILTYILFILFKNSLNIHLLIFLSAFIGLLVAIYDIRQNKNAKEGQ